MGWFTNTWMQCDENSLERVVYEMCNGHKERSAAIKVLSVLDKGVNRAA